jgi:hypothetical protein
VHHIQNKANALYSGGRADPALRSNRNPRTRGNGAGMPLKPLTERYPGRGRPPLDVMNHELIEPLEEYLRDGMFFKEACRLVGVSPTTVGKWVRAGQHDLQAGRETSNAEFAVRVTQAIEYAKHDRIKRIAEAAEKNPAFWTADAWWLERRHPEEFGRQDRINMNLNGNLNLSRVAELDLSEDEINALRGIFGKLGISESGDSQEDPFGLESSDSDGDFPLS